MALDRIDIGLGPRLGAAPTDTSGFQFTGQTALSADEYQSRRVDFTKEYYGLPGLEAESGIGVDAPKVGEDIAPFQQQQDTGDDDDIPVFGGNLIQGTGESQQIKFTDDVLASGMTEFATYSDYLRSAGKMDRVDLIQGLIEPAVRGDFKDMDFSKLGKEVEQIPGKAKEGVEKVVKEGLTEEQFAKGIFSTLGGPVGSMISSFFGGQVVKNAFGNNSQRGFIADVNMAKQYQDMAAIRAAQAAATGAYDSATGKFVPNITNADMGFAMQIGAVSGVTRAPGARSYSGNYGNMSFEQIKDLEAISKGYLPETYQFDTTKTKNIFGGKANVTISGSGGETVSGNIMDGFYTAEGRFYTPGFGYSKVGTESAMNKFAATNAGKYGISKEAAEKAILDARNGSGTVAQNLRDAQAAALAESRQQREEEARRAEEARLAEAQRQAGLRRAAQPGRDSGGDDYASLAYSGTGQDSSSSSAASYSGRGIGGEFGMAAGGRVGMAAGGPMAAGMASGFVDRPPSQVSEEQTVADNVETQLPEGAFVINAAAVEFAGEKDIQKMLVDAQKEAVRRGIVLDKPDNSAKLIDVAISRGEVTVAPYLAKIIGYDRLTKINNRGKPEVAERQREASSGGFI